MPLPTTDHIKFGDGLSVIDEGAGVITVNAVSGAGQKPFIWAGFGIGYQSVPVATTGYIMQWQAGTTAIAETTTSPSYIRILQKGYYLFTGYVEGGVSAPPSLAYPNTLYVALTGPLSRRVTGLVHKDSSGPGTFFAVQLVQHGVCVVGDQIGISVVHSQATGPAQIRGGCTLVQLNTAS